MDVTEKDLEVFDAITAISNFTISELFVSVTHCEKIENGILNSISPIDTANGIHLKYAYKVKFPNAVNIELSMLQNTISKFINQGLLKSEPNYQNNNIKICFFDINDELQALEKKMLSYSSQRYYKTDDFEYCKNHKFKTLMETNKELEEKKETRRKFWHDWAPLIVSTVALLITALPAYLNYHKTQKQVVVIEYDQNINQLIKLQNKDIQELKEKINDLSLEIKTHK